jgi:hypothetical protein
MQRRLGNPEQSSSALLLGSNFREIGQSLKKILSFALKEKSMFVGFTVMVLAFCLGVKVTIVVLKFSDTMTSKSWQKNKHRSEIQSKQSFSRLIGRGILRVLYLGFLMSDFRILRTDTLAQHFLRLGVSRFSEL